MPPAAADRVLQLYLMVNTPQATMISGEAVLPNLLEGRTEAGGWEWGLKGLSTSSATVQLLSGV